MQEGFCTFKQNRKSTEAKALEKPSLSSTTRSLELTALKFNFREENVELVFVKICIFGGHLGNEESRIYPQTPDSPVIW